MAGHWLQSNAAVSPTPPPFSASPLSTEQIKDKTLRHRLDKPSSTWAGTAGGRVAAGAAWRCR